MKLISLRKLFEIRRLSDLPVFNKARTAQRHTHTLQPHPAQSAGCRSRSRLKPMDFSDLMWFVYIQVILAASYQPKQLQVKRVAPFWASPLFWDNKSLSAWPEPPGHKRLKNKSLGFIRPIPVSSARFPSMQSEMSRFQSTASRFAAHWWPARIWCLAQS